MLGIKISIFIFIALISSSLFINAYAVDNNCRVNIWNFFDLPHSLGCIEDRLDALENATPFSDQTTASNLGSIGEGIFASEVENDLQFKKLVAGTGITLNSNSTRVMINSTGGGGDTTVCSNVGTGNPLHKTGTNCNAFSLIAGDGITITNTTDDYTINATRIGQAGIINHVQIIKNNIGTVYIDVYNVLLQAENLNMIDCSRISELRITDIWDYVGSGTHQIRWVDKNNNANILNESPTFTADQNPYDSGWFTKPSWCSTDSVKIEMQGKSTMGTDDPISIGYTILVR